MERDGLRTRIISEVSIEDMYRALHATNQHGMTLGTFQAWQRLVHFSTGGQFKDVLLAHADSLTDCIKAAGGLKVAMDRIIKRDQLDEDTWFWPEHFRIKVNALYM
jgi:hypothetical protein